MLSICSALFLLLSHHHVTSETRANHNQLKDLPPDVEDIASLIPRPPQTPYLLFKHRKSSGIIENVPLRFLLNHTRVVHQGSKACTKHHPMVCLVQSSCTNRDQRNAIRRSWAQDASLYNIPVIFFVGARNCLKIRKESEDFQDIVELDVEDSHLNKTIKSLARLKWYVEHCEGASYLHIVDDDVVVNVERIVGYLEEHDELFGYSAVGKVHQDVPVERDPNSEDFVPTWVLPYDKHWKFLFGGSYVLSWSVVKDLYEASLHLPIMATDSAFVTGVLGDFVGINLRNEDKFERNGIECTKCGFDAPYSCHEKLGLEPEDMTYIWKKMKECKKSDT